MIRKDELAHFFVMPIIIGSIGGASAIAFRAMISFFSSTFKFVDIFHTNYFYLFTMPILFFISNILISKFLIDHSNVTIDDIAKRVALYRGHFSHTRGALVLLLSSIGIGFGAPVGREGPIAKLGGVGTELLLKMLRVQRENIPIYLSAGVSAAIAATFNAPIAGVIFGLEIIIGKVNSYIVIPLIVASTTATVISDHFIGDFTAFYVPKIDYSDKYFLFVPILSILFALASAILLNSLRKLNKIRISFGERWKYISILIGFLVGLVIVAVPQTKGVGYDYVTQIFVSGFDSNTSLEIFLAKLAIVVLSIGSGIFGGLMSPSIFIGAFGGYWAGESMLHLGANPQAFALIGSAAMLAGVSRAPLRAAVIITELTHSYQLLPAMLMASAITGYVLSKFEPGSYFKRCLIRKGIDVENDNVDRFFENLNIRDYIEEIPPIHSYTEIKRLKKIFRRFRVHHFPVVDNQHKLIGMVSMRDLKRRYMAGKRKKRAVEIMSKNPFVISEDYSTEDIYKAISTIDSNYIPYASTNGKYLGMVNLNKLIKAISLVEHHYEIGSKPKNL